MKREKLERERLKKEKLNNDLFEAARSEMGAVINNNQKYEAEYVNIHGASPVVLSEYQ